MSESFDEAKQLVAMEDRYLGIDWYKAAKGQMRRLLARIAELEKMLEPEWYYDLDDPETPVDDLRDLVDHLPIGTVVRYGVAVEVRTGKVKMVYDEAADEYRVVEVSDETER